MKQSAPSCLIGVDGGGTSCRMALVADGRRTEVRTTRANVHTDPEGALATLLAGLDALVDKAGLPRSALAESCAYVGLAGVTGSQSAALVAKRLPVGRVQVADDRMPAVVGALGDLDGAVAGLGTGSFFARQAAGSVQLRGGWGLVLGDEASGAWLGRGLLARVLHVEDGLFPASSLTRAARARFPGGPDEIVAFAGTARPGDFAEYAPEIMQAADHGDPAGRALVADGAAHIARAVSALGWRSGEPLCLVGGLAAGYRAWLSPELAQAVTPPLATALDGALQLAERLAGADV